MTDSGHGSSLPKNMEFTNTGSGSSLSSVRSGYKGLKSRRIFPLEGTSAVAVDPRTEAVEVSGAGQLGDVSEGAGIQLVVQRDGDGPGIGRVVIRWLPSKDRVISARADSRVDDRCSPSPSRPPSPRTSVVPLGSSDGATIRRCPTRRATRRRCSRGRYRLGEAPPPTAAHPHRCIPRGPHRGSRGPPLGSDPGT